MPAATLVLAAAIVGLLVGSALIPGAPIFGLPTIVGVIAAVLVLLAGIPMREYSTGRRSKTADLTDEG